MLDTVYSVTFPDEYTDWIDALKFSGLDIEEAIPPGVCVGGVRFGPSFLFALAICKFAKIMRPFAEIIC